MPKLTPNKESLEKAKILMKKPLRENKINMPIIDPSIKPGFIHQVDLLFLPNDNGYKYALVVVDIGSRICQAQPVKTKKSKDVLQAIRKIYNGKILKLPHQLQVDSGTEFTGLFKKYFSHNIIRIPLRVAKPNRHRQQALIERYNGMISKSIFEILHALEIQTGETQTQWVADLPLIIKEINKGAKKRVQALKNIDPTPTCDGISCELLNEGDQVYIISDQPRDITNIKLAGKFRGTDLRWEPDKRTITMVIIRPYQPPLYRVNGVDNVAYTRQQLQLIKKA